MSDHFFILTLNNSFSFTSHLLLLLYLFVPLPHLPQVIDVKLWFHIFFPVESYEGNLKTNMNIIISQFNSLPA